MPSATKTVILAAILSMTGMISRTEAVYNGEAESNCSLDNVPAPTSFLPQTIEGIWYPVYQSHLPAYMASVSLMWSDYKYMASDDGEESWIVANTTIISEAGGCSSFVNNYTYNCSIPGKLVTEENVFGQISVKNDLYILGITDTLMAAFSEVLINGELSKDSSTVVLAVRNLSQSVVLPSQLKTKLQEFCTETAGCLSFFQEKQLYLNATCTA